MEKSTLSIKETLSITFRTLKILFHAAPGGIAFLGILSTIAGVCPFLTLILSRAFLDSLARACGQQAFEMEIICSKTQLVNGIKPTRKNLARSSRTQKPTSGSGGYFQMASEKRLIAQRQRRLAKMCCKLSVMAKVMLKS